jgi:hypothetical protein
MATVDELRAKFRKKYGSGVDKQPQPETQPEEDEAEEEEEETGRVVDVGKLRAERRMKMFEASEFFKAKLKESKPASSESPTRWHETTTPGGDRDAVLMFGRHKGKSLTQLATEDYESRSYVRWILREDFDEELKEIAREVLERLGFGV